MVYEHCINYQPIAVGIGDVCKDHAPAYGSCPCGKKNGFDVKRLKETVVHGGIESHGCPNCQLSYTEEQLDSVDNGDGTETATRRYTLYYNGVTVGIYDEKSVINKKP